MISHSQNEEIEIKSHKLSFYLLIIITGFLFSLIFIRLVYLQIYEGEDLRRYSDSNRFRKQFLNAPRGLVLDRNNKILIGNKNIMQLKFNLNHTSDNEEILKKISPIINIPIEKIKEKLEKGKKSYGHYHPITIKQSLNLDEIHKLKLLHWNHPEIYVEETHIRVYPLKENASQILGYVGEVSKKELIKFKKKKTYLNPLDIIGKEGIENLYDSHLKGTHGWNFVEVDALNRISPKTISPPFFLKNNPKQGENIVLTLDKDLQEFVYKAMDKKDSIGPRKGSVIVMKTNGEILAWLSLPSFDSNTFSLELSEKDWQELSRSDSKFFINKGFQEHYSPGSTFKPFIAIAALSEGIILKETLLDSPNKLKFGNRIFHDHSVFNHGPINVITALEKSVNTFFYKIGAKLGIDKIVIYADLFGFGHKTNIKLKGESQGLLPNPLWKQHKFQKSWQLGDTINTSIGQGSLLTTLLQLTVAYNAIATEGLLVKPFIIKKISDQIIKHTIKDTLTDRIDRKHFITIKKGLQQVIEGSHGTARYWKIPKIPYGGKTGTSQVISFSSKNLYGKCNSLPEKYRHHGLFIGMAPIQQPQIIVSVLTEHSCFGSLGSVPIARDIIKYYISKNKKKTR